MHPINRWNLIYTHRAANERLVIQNIEFILITLCKLQSSLSIPVDQKIKNGNEFRVLAIEIDWIHSDNQLRDFDRWESRGSGYGREFNHGENKFMLNAIHSIWRMGIVFFQG